MADKITGGSDNLKGSRPENAGREHPPTKVDFGPLIKSPTTLNRTEFSTRETEPVTFDTSEGAASRRRSKTGAILDLPSDAYYESQGAKSAKAGREAALTEISGSRNVQADRISTIKQIIGEPGDHAARVEAILKSGHSDGRD